MRALATVDDVQRVMGDDDSGLIKSITAALEGASDWVRQHLGRNYDEAGDYTAKFYDVRDDAIMELPEEDADVTGVRVYIAPSADSLDLDSSGYQVMRGRRVQLMTRTGPFPLMGYSQTTGTYSGGRTLAIEYARVEVDYTASGSVPPRVREATALIAAAWVLNAPTQASGLKSEAIGDYNYSYGPDGAGATAAIPAFARTLLGNAKRSRVSVV